MQGKAKRQSKREEARRKAAYSVSFKSASSAISLSEQDATHLFSAISSNCIAQFGIVRLAELNLNTPYPLQLIASDALRQKLSMFGDTATLIDAACAQDSDQIVSSLLRAGASPSQIEHERVRKFLFEELPIQYATWICMKILRDMQMQLSAKFEMCQKCIRESTSTSVRGFCWPCCSAKICEICLWKHICRFETIRWFRCNCCGLRCDTKVSETQELMGVSFDELFSGTYSNGNTLIEEQRNSIVHRREESLSKWKLLPITNFAAVDCDSEEAVDAAEKSKKTHTHRRPRKFFSQSMAEICSSMLGENKIKRTEKLFQAVIDGLPDRIVALSHAGINVNIGSIGTSDAQDRDAQIVGDGVGNDSEYGKTPLHVAVSYRNVDVVKALLWAGADVDLPDNGGNTALIIASATKQQEIVDLLLMMGALPDIRNFWGLSASDLLIQRGESPGTLCASFDLLLSKTPPIINKIIGADCFVIDNIFPDEFLETLVRLWGHLPTAPPCKATNSYRRYYCDSSMNIRRIFVDHLVRLEQEMNRTVEFYPLMRFLAYERVGGGLPAHIDLTRSLPSSQIFIDRKKIDEIDSNDVSDPKILSTHTFILYLTDCEEGGETVFLRSMKKSVLENNEDGNYSNAHVLLGPPDNLITSVKPKRGRLLLFPHNYVHAGLPVKSVPKLLLRGEALLVDPN